MAAVRRTGEGGIAWGHDPSFAMCTAMLIAQQRRDGVEPHAVLPVLVPHAGNDRVVRVPLTIDDCLRLIQATSAALVRLREAE